MECAETKATQSCEQQVDAKNLGQVEGGLPGAGVLPDLEVPKGPVPDRGKEQQATENDVGSGHTFKAPEAWVNTGFAGNAPAAPAAGDSQASHKGHDEHALTPHGVQNGI